MASLTLSPCHSVSQSFLRFAFRRGLLRGRFAAVPTALAAVPTALAAAPATVAAASAAAFATTIAAPLAAVPSAVPSAVTAVAAILTFATGWRSFFRGAVWLARLAALVLQEGLARHLDAVLLVDGNHLDLNLVTELHHVVHLADI